MTTDSLSQRLIDIEHRLAHSERVNEDLSAIVARQAAEIDLLNRKIEVLSGRLKEAASQWEASPQDSKPPPHY